MSNEEMAMFPLQRPCVPGGVLPLRIFEERYIRMLDRILGDPSPEFCVVMIDRGSEVGGGDIRRSIGTKMLVARVEQLPLGHRGVIAVGTERVHVTEWLEDDPYPKARIEPYPPPKSVFLDSEFLDEGRAVEGLPLLSNVLRSPDFAAEPFGSLDFSDRVFSLASRLPIGSLDLQLLLEARGPRDLAEVMEQILEHLADLSRFTES